MAEAKERTETYNVTIHEGKSNWLTWKLRVEHMLLDRELMGYVDGTITLDVAAEESAQTVFKRKSQKALTAIVMAIGDTPASLIRCCKSPADAWSKLVNKYEKSTMTGKLHLCQRFFTMKFA